MENKQQQIFHSQAFKQAQMYANNASEHVWWPASARTRWGSLSAPLDLLAAMRGPTSKGKGGEGKEGRERKKGRKGKGGRVEEREEGMACLGSKNILVMSL